MDSAGGHYWNVSTTRELTLSRYMQVHQSNSTVESGHRMKWRTSVGASAHRSEVDYVASVGTHGTEFTFGVFGSNESMATHTAKYLGGWRTPPLAGAPATFYNTGQNKTANINFINQIDGAGTHMVNTTLAWKQIWWAFLEIRSVEASIGATWNNRPTAPTAVVNNLGLLNHYANISAELQNAECHNIEISVADIDLIPCIVFIMGAAADTFNVNQGPSVNGNRVVPHHHAHALPVKGYYIVVRDSAAPLSLLYNLNGTPQPGLAINTMAAGQVVGAFNNDILHRTLLALAVSFPVADDAEAAWISTSVGMFAENFRGVRGGLWSGDTARGVGYDAMLRGGATLIPVGSEVCSMLTMFTQSSVGTKECERTVAHLLAMSAGVDNVRTAIEPFIMVFQRASRQIGLTVPMYFPHAEPRNSLRPNAGIPGGALATNAVMYNRTVMAEVQAPGELMEMASAMCEVVLGCTIPRTLMFYGIGDQRSNATGPFANNGDNGANRGECYASVHPAQIVTGLFSEKAAGLAGIPHNLEKVAEELTLKRVGGNGVWLVDGTSGSEETLDEGIKLDVGEGMLGHSIILRRNASAGSSAFRLGFSPAPANGTGGTITITFEEFPNYERRAVCPDDDPNNRGGGWNVRADICHNHLELFSDFEAYSVQDLRLGVTEGAGGTAIAQNVHMRSAVPGYIATVLQAQVRAGVYGAVGMMAFPPRKKKKLNLPNPSAKIATDAETK